MDSPYFSVIVPFYNKEKTLDACIRSLLSQDFLKDRYEVITVNNNSDDHSLSIINRFPSIKLVHEKQQNPYAARNTGISNSSGSIMVFTDADVVVQENWLSNIYSAINKNGLDILIGWYTASRPIKLLQIHSLLISHRIKKAIRQKNPCMLTACAANLIIKREVFEQEGLFLNNSNSEDMYFSMRCHEKGYNIGFDDSIEVKRNDIDSTQTFLLKNFIYGCSGTLGPKHKLHILENLKYALLTIRFAFKHFPVGIGLILFTCSYFTGYVLTKSKIISPKNLTTLITKHTNHLNKKGP